MTAGCPDSLDQRLIHPALDAANANSSNASGFGCGDEIVHDVKIERNERIHKL
jgi:hypothetical protein